jgi:hypothetical protein
MKVPAGGVIWPLELSPQQVTLPPLVKAQL